MGSGLAAAFGRVLRERRRATGLSQEALAERADLSRSYVSMLERGLHYPSLDIVFALAEVFECEPSRLVEEVQQQMREG